MAGDVFFVNGEVHGVMMIGFRRFAFERGGGVLILRGQRIKPPIIPTEEPRGTLE